LDRQPGEQRYQYRTQILAELSRHGVIPRDTTPPALLSEFVNDLYRYELRRLRERLIRREIPKTGYSTRVIELRKKYPLVSIPLADWIEPKGRGDGRSVE
jgi:hypothetical protein